LLRVSWLLLSSQSFHNAKKSMPELEKRRKKYGDERPFGILGLYDHLAGMLAQFQFEERDMFLG
jgi:hypothetical protein